MIYDDLTYNYNGKNMGGKSFNYSDSAFIFLKKRRDGNVMLEKAKWNQNEHKSYLNEIKKGKNKYNEQKSALYNIKTLYKAQNSVIKFFDCKASLESETKFRAIHGKGLKDYQ